MGVDRWVIFGCIFSRRYLTCYVLFHNTLYNNVFVVKNNGLMWQLSIKIFEWIKVFFMSFEGIKSMYNVHVCIPCYLQTKKKCSKLKNITLQ